MRPSARKNISQESEISFDVDTTGDVGFEHTMKLPSRTSKSWRKIIIQRLVRTFRAISIIAAVNVPLYMILLFKDWIDWWRWFEYHNFVALFYYELKLW